MAASLDSFPVLNHQDSALTIATTWRVGDAERRRLVADTVARVWTDRDWPDRKMLSYTVLGSVHGNSLLHYSQWSSPEVTAARERNQDRRREIDQAVPGIERLGGLSYRPYRGTVRRPDADRPGCYLVVHAHFHRPHARGWADGVLRAADTAPRRPEGLIGAHFHLSGDGRAALVVSGWTDEQALQYQVEQPGGPIDEATRSSSALDRISVERFQLLHHLQP